MGRTGKIIIFACCLAALLPCTVFATQFSIQASVDKNTVALNDVVQYTVTVNGNDANNLPEPSKPSFSNLEIISRSQSSNISIINTRVSAAYSHVYILKPQNIGEANIGISKAAIGGEEYQTQPISITVTKASAIQKKQSAPPKTIWDEPVSDPVLVATTVSRNTSFVNQMVILTFTFYRRVNLFEAPTYTPPSTIGFWSVNLPAVKQERYADIKGVRYLAQDFKTALFPTQSGDLTIGQAAITAKVDPFSAAVTIKTNPINIKALPLPEAGKPDDFAGTVGRFTMSSSVDKRIIERGKPFTLRVKIIGEGNINSISEPIIQLGEKVKQLSATSKDNIIKGFSAVSGSKTFEYILMPVGEGSAEVGPVDFSYFNPSEGKYYKLSTVPNNIKILPSSIPLPKEIGASAKQSDQPVVRVSRKIILNILLFVFVAALLGSLIIGMIWIYKKYQDYLHSDPVKVRKRRAMKAARKGLKRARGLLRNGKLKEFVAEIYEAVAHYLGDKYNFSSAGITQDQLKDILSQKGIDPNVQREIDRFIYECDLIRFTPSSLDKAKAEELLKIAEELIVSIEVKR